MKKTQIIGIIFIAVCLGALISTLQGSGKMSDFSEAFENPEREYRVKGVLDRSAEIIYEPTENTSLTVFSMKDDGGQVRRVHLQESKPQGFEQSESIVVIGKAEGDVFIAKDMQMKCPSKYNEDKHMVDQAGI
jgi:cytochrome c-type biogenesis protein CcmE